jgi:hypothetical protein
VMGLGGAPPGTKDNAAVDPPGNEVASIGPSERATPSDREAEKHQAPDASEVIASRGTAQPDATVPVRLLRAHRTIPRATADKVAQAASPPDKVVSPQTVRPPTVVARSNGPPDLAADRFIDPAGTAR